MATLELSPEAGNNIGSCLYPSHDDTWRDLQQRSVTPADQHFLCQRACRLLEAGLNRTDGRAESGALEEFCRNQLSGLLPAPHLARLLELATTPTGPLRALLRGDGHLAALPWELICPGGEGLLVERFRVGRQVMGLGEPGAPHTPPVPREFIRATEKVQVLLLADPGHLNAVEEVHALRAFLDTRPEVVVDFHIGWSADQLQKKLSHYHVIHFAGDVVPGDANKTPRWRLNDGQTFGASDIKFEKAPAWPLLVFANACRQAELDRQPGTWGADDLAFHFLRKGVRHFIGTFARIPDDVLVIEFAKAFYQNLFDGARCPARRSPRPGGRLARRVVNRTTAGDCWR